MGNDAFYFIEDNYLIVEIFGLKLKQGINTERKLTIRIEAHILKIIFVDVIKTSCFAEMT